MRLFSIPCTIKKLENSFEFCQTSPCCLNGTEDLMDYTCEKLGVKIGETTADGL
jgi:NADH:ubiquinone oxidoreductase subunit E